MKLRTTFLSQGRRFDISISAEATTTVGDLTAHLAASRDSEGAPERLGIAVQPGTADERIVSPSVTLGDAGMISGDAFTLARVGEDTQRRREQIATLNVVAGPDMPASHPIHRGSNTLGRGPDCEIRLTDPLVSKRHARIVVSDIVEIVDDSSANGIQVGGRTVDRAILRPGEQVTVGDTTIAVTLDVTELEGVQAGHRDVVFNRSPRVELLFEGEEIEAPEPPEQVQARRFPIITLIAPLLMAGVIFAVTRNPLSILFVALSPMMVVGSYAEQKYANKRSLAQATEAFSVALDDLRTQLEAARAAEIAARLAAHPATADVMHAVVDASPLVWTRRPQHDTFLEVRVGVAPAPSRNKVVKPPFGRSVPSLRRDLESLIDEFATTGPVPITVDLPGVGSAGIGGPAPLGPSLRNMVLAEIVGLHSPADVVVAGVISAPSEALEWLKWIPHVHSDFSPLHVDHLASTSTDAAILVGAIEELMATRRANADRPGAASTTNAPAVVLVVDDDAPTDRARLVQIAEHGPEWGVHVIWGAPSVAALPSACQAFIGVDASSGSVHAGFVNDHVTVEALVCEQPTPADMVTFARSLAPLVDGGARVVDDSDLPNTVSFLGLAGSEIAESADAIIETWLQNHSLPDPSDPARGRSNSLRALVGQGADGPVHLDLRVHGPHALVGGTTGSGKSEFLQTWVIGMASMHSPKRVTFLFVDYKGGSAFGECVDLPHSVGLVTDLSPHLVKRALTSLEAEVRHREEILNAKKAKDLLELEQRNDPDAPPSLVIVVDEFAALAADVPEFVDGVVNIAQRGRSLGLHLILATQRPAGVIKDNLRANTNLRIALRMADEGDSTDVVGVPIAAGFDPDRPGRAVAKTGPGRLVSFQAAYVGGRTSTATPRPDIHVEDLVIGVGAVWSGVEEPSEPTRSDGPSDLRRMVDVVGAASVQRSLPAPRRPWLPELAAAYDLASLGGGGDRDLVVGLVDQPDRQRQTTVAFHPDADGNLAIFGTGGSGKSTMLRTLAAASSIGAERGNPWRIYGLDFGARGLQMLETLPTVGSIIVGDDGERVARTLRMLRTTIDERAARYAGVRAGTIDEYRRAVPDSDDARILLLVDGIGAFRTAYEGTLQNKLWDTFQSIMSEGRSVGVHVAVSADRASAIPSGIASLIQRRVILRLAGANDYMLLGASAEVLSSDSPPGRGLVDGREAQVAILGGRSEMSNEAEALEALARRLREQGVADVEPVRSLPELVALGDLPSEVAGRPVFALADDTLTAAGLPDVATFLVCGPAASGRTTTIATIARAIGIASPDRRRILFASPRSSLVDAIEWDDVAVGPAEIANTAGALQAETESAPPWTIFIESVGDLLNSDADLPLQALLKACRANGHAVVAESETSTLVGSWPLLQLVKFSRAGLALQPDAIDGDNLFKVSFPRLSRAEFPPGRGLLVHNGATRRLQVAVAATGSGPHVPEDPVLVP